MRKLRFFGVPALIACLAVAAYAYQGIQKGQYATKSVVFSLAAGVAQRLNDPAALSALGLSHYNEVCFVNTTAGASAVYITTDNPTLPGDEATTGWPLIGSEKECHDWDQGVDLYGWCNVAGLGCPKEVRVLFVR